MRSVLAPRVWLETIGLLALGGSTLTSQLPPAVQWSLEGNLGSYCVWYLADPELARQLVPVGTALAPAGTGAGLPPLLARTVQDEPRFAQWIPGSICVGSYQLVTSAGRTLAQGKANRPVVVALNSLAAPHARGFESASSYLIGIMTDQRSLARAGDAVGLNMDGIRVTSRTRVGADDPEVIIDAAGVRITWTGHAIGDSGVGKTRSVSFGYGNGRGGGVLVELESSPAGSRLMVGSLELDGTNTLAKALKASPVRGIGPEERGGTTTLTFHQATRK